MLAVTIRSKSQRGGGISQRRPFSNGKDHRRSNDRANDLKHPGGDHPSAGRVPEGLAGDGAGGGGVGGSPACGVVGYPCTQEGGRRRPR